MSRERSDTFNHFPSTGNSFCYYFDRFCYYFDKCFGIMLDFCISCFFALLLFLSYCVAKFALVWQKRNEQKKRSKILMNYQLSDKQYKEATSLMMKYHCYNNCPICLEDYEHVTNVSSTTGFCDEESLLQMEYVGSDKAPIQLLRCGHSCCRQCWEDMVYGKNTPTSCWVCRQDFLVVNELEMKIES